MTNSHITVFPPTECIVHVTSGTLPADNLIKYSCYSHQLGDNYLATVVISNPQQLWWLAATVNKVIKIYTADHTGMLKLYNK